MDGIIEEIKNDIACYESFERKDSDMVAIALGKLKRLVDIIEKKNEALNKIIGLEWWGMENPVTTIAQEALRQDLGTFEIDTTPDELQRLREE